jgi:hypothetical protein
MPKQSRVGSPLPTKAPKSKRSVINKHTVRWAKRSVPTPPDSLPQIAGDTGINAGHALFYPLAGCQKDSSATGWWARGAHPTVDFLCATAAFDYECIGIDLGVVNTNTVRLRVLRRVGKGSYPPQTDTSSRCQTLNTTTLKTHSTQFLTGWRRGHAALCPPYFLTYPNSIRVKPTLRVIDV